jgi:divalent metal cation (Fe/Co/Zn/Cd) transporter
MMGDHIVDIFATSVSLVTMIIGLMIPEASIIVPIGGLIIGLFTILRWGIDVIPDIRSLWGTAVDRDTYNRILTKSTISNTF